MAITGQKVWANSGKSAPRSSFLMDPRLPSRVGGLAVGDVPGRVGHADVSERAREQVPDGVRIGHVTAHEAVPADLVDVSGLDSPLFLELFGVVEIRSRVVPPGTVQVVLLGQALEQLLDALLLGFDLGQEFPQALSVDGGHGRDGIEGEEGFLLFLLGELDIGDGYLAADVPRQVRSQVAVQQVTGGTVHDERGDPAEIVQRSGERLPLQSGVSSKVARIVQQDFRVDEPILKDPVLPSE